MGQRLQTMLAIVLVGAALVGPASATPARAAPAADAVVGGSCTEADLETALAAGGAITFDCGGPKTIQLTSAKTISQDTTLDGGDVITLTGALATRLFNVDSGVAFRLEHIVLDEASNSGSDGGAISNHGRLTLDHATVENSQTDSGHSGGAIFSDGPLTLTDSSLFNNTAGSAGALFANFGAAVVSVSDSTFSGNRADNFTTGYGGAVWVGRQAQIAISGGVITSNTAQFGGGLYVDHGATMTLAATGAPALIDGNTATQAGGGIYNSIGNVTLANVLLQDNKAHNPAPAVHTFGGAIDDFQGALIASSATITANAAMFGGGVYVTSGTLTLDNSQLISNTALEDGGGIENENSAQVELSQALLSRNSAHHVGGGIENNASGLTLAHVTFSDNAAEYGGGLDFVFSQATLGDLTFSGNMATAAGGGIDIGESTVTATDILLTHNQADIGGGMYVVVGGLVLTNGTFSGNQATDGGGLDNDGGGVELTNVTFDGNLAGSGGGGVYDDESAFTALTNVTLSNNTATLAGGGLDNEQGSTAALTNVTLSGNSAPSGNEVYDGAGSVALTNVTLSGQAAHDNNGGGLLFTASARVTQTITLSNTLLAGTPAGVNCAGAGAVSTGYNLSSDDSCASFLTHTGDLNQAGPHLGPLANYGGPTRTQLPGAGSPAIDAIPSGANGCGTFITTDQRAAPRPINGKCDIGAVEAGWPFPQVWLAVVRR